MQDKVFVSPGVYTSERDLSFVTTNVGVTTLGLVGEVTKGPAFKPIFISNYTEFKTFFGGLNPKKNKDTGFLQYELPYVAKSYLQNSNQMYVTRVLGLSGYDAGAAWTITADGVVVAVLRSRGSYTRDVNGIETFVPAVPALGTVTLVPDGTTEGVFTITADGETYPVSLIKTRKDYITKVLGTTAQDGKTKLFVEEIYPNTIESVALEAISINKVTTFHNYKEEYKPAYTPYIVSEVKGNATNNTIEKLFRFKTIADGESANTNVKVSIVNIKPDEREFDVIVREFNDTDANPIMLERFSKCTMNPASNNYIARKIGTSNGDFVSRSAYILVEMAEGGEAINDSFPAGFEGYAQRGDLAGAPEIVYKAQYLQYENPRRLYLGLTPNMDTDFLKYKGLEETLDNESNTVYVPLTGKTKGFHLDMHATGTEFVGGAAEFKNELALNGTVYEKAYARKFTVAFAGGFDGWDVYRTSRSNTEQFTIQRLPQGQTQFEEIILTDGDRGVKSDYYAFLEAIRTFSNPESFDINVFATPGIDAVNHSDLTEYAIEMIERERSDSLYIITLPDTNTDGSIKTPFEAAEDIYGMFDSNYTATYWPWIQQADNENNAMVYLPPTGEVLRNIALTDNTSYPWFAVAGFARGDVKAVKARLKLTQADRDVLYEGRINPIATFTGEGVKIFGNKNLQVKNSSLDRINVRRLLLQTRKLISAVAVRLLFDQNDEAVRSEFLRQVNPILESIRKERGLKDFRVKLIDTPEDMERNTLSGKIFIKPTNALEYIELEFNVMPTGASFEDL